MQFLRILSCRFFVVDVKISNILPKTGSTARISPSEAQCVSKELFLTFYSEVYKQQNVRAVYKKILLCIYC